jgi:hypothetical protein
MPDICRRLLRGCPASVRKMCERDRRERIAKAPPVAGATMALIQPLISLFDPKNACPLRPIRGEADRDGYHRSVRSGIYIA